MFGGRQQCHCYRVGWDQREDRWVCDFGWIGDVVIRTSAPMSMKAVHARASPEAGWRGIEKALQASSVFDYSIASWMQILRGGERISALCEEPRVTHK